MSQKDKKLEGEQIFGEFFRREREKRNVPKQVVCEGICSKMMVTGLETGERSLNLVLLDRLSGRLGIDLGRYEIYVGLKEYQAWENRTRILDLLTHRKLEEAERELASYRQAYGEKNPLEEQFCAAQTAFLAECRHAPKAEVRSCLEQAIRLTVREWEGKVQGKTLSCAELDLMLRLEHLRETGERAERYLEIEEYLSTASYDTQSLAKIYPETVVYLARCTDKGNTRLSQANVQC